MKKLVVVVPVTGALVALGGSQRPDDAESTRGGWLSLDQRGKPPGDALVEMLQLGLRQRRQRHERERTIAERREQLYFSGVSKRCFTRPHVEG